MNDDARFPIKTTREGNKITKVCVEDVYKILNRVIEQLDKTYNKSIEIIDDVYKEVDDFEGNLIIGTGVSQPCLTDAFDEEIGNNVAFMKAKLNANIKKYNLLMKLSKQVFNLADVIEEEIDKVMDYIILDVKGIRNYNPEYLKSSEFDMFIG